MGIRKKNFDARIRIFLSWVVFTILVFVNSDFIISVSLQQNIVDL